MKHFDLKAGARVVVLVPLVLGCAESVPEQSVERRASAFRFVGSTTSVLKEAVSTRAGAWERFSFLTPFDERIGVRAEDFHFSGDYLSATGTAAESDNSAFILKGDSAGIYGWVVLHDRNVAYEYTTASDGRVQVQQVPVKKILPVCEFDHEPGAVADADDGGSPALDAAAGLPPHIGAYDGTANTNKLQSKPGATKVLFMDVAPLPLDKAQLWRAWQIVSAAYSAFDVNVTTDAAVYEATEMRNRGKSCSRREMGRSSCYVNAFGTNRCCDVYNKGNGHYQGLTTTHELGHLMGLDHDGTGSSEYFGGLSSFRWCPIMGTSSPKTSWGNAQLFQWSKGEYTNADEKEDDLMIISRNLPFRPDDIATSKALVVKNGELAASDNFGQIASNTDSDTFTFTVGAGGGRAMLTIDRIEDIGGGYLDVEAELQTAAGMMLARGNDMNARTAKLDAMLPAGDYKLIIKGGAEGTPQNGFSNYSSLGFYGITGAITGAVGGGMGGTGGAPGMGGSGGAAGAAGAGGAGGASGADAGVRDAGGGTGTDGGTPDTGTGTGTGGAGTGGSGGGTVDGGGAITGAAGASGSGGGSGIKPQPPVEGGCAVAGRAANASGGTAGVMLMLAIVAVGRHRRRAPQKTS